MLLWIFFAAVYLAALFVLGLSTLRKGHTALFIIGIFLPFLWIVGALSQPTQEAARLQ
jgi:4-amino-4-deoxy-L-arabinose transferase-like glycosyltransferase